MSPSVLEHVDIFHGELAPQRASVYVRLLEHSSRDGYRLTGHIRGPFSLRGETLPATHPFQDQGPGDSLLVRASVPDPVRWSIDQPATYTITLELSQAGTSLAREQFSFAFRGIAIQGKQLLKDAKPFVLRGATSPLEAPTAVSWLESTDELACYLPVGASLPSSATAEGVSLVATVSNVSAGATAAEQVAHVRKLTHNPAITIAILPSAVGEAVTAAKLPLNLLKGYSLRSADPLEIPAWCEVAFLHLSKEHQGAPSESLTTLCQQALALPCPVVIVASQPKLPLEHRREACNALQRHLAPLGQFAGYVV